MDSIWGWIHLISEPPVQNQPFYLRALAHTVIWTLLLTILQTTVLAVVTALRTTHVKQSARSPQHSTARMMLHCTIGYINWSLPVGLYAAWLNPGAPGGFAWDYSLPNFVGLVYFSLAVLMAWDAWSFFHHRWLHLNKTAFTLVHAKHHEHQAALSVRTGGYMTATEGFLSDALPLLVMYALGAAIGNWWYPLAAFWNGFFITVIGHCGYDISTTHFLDSILMVINPMIIGYMGSPVRATPRDHELHHTYPRKNFAFFFTYWDDIYGTLYDALPIVTLPVLAVHAVYAVVVISTLYHILVFYPVSFITTWVLLYLVIPPTAASAVANWVGLPEVTRRLFGWAMDIYRRDNYVTYAPSSAVGSFQAATAAATPTAAGKGAKLASPFAPKSSPDSDTKPVRDQDSKDTAAAAADDPSTASDASPAAQQAIQSPAYIFACHPTGLLSRAAFLTFGARGWCSPVSGLPRVRMAVSSILLRVPVPFWREFLLACGCVPADRRGLRQALLSGTSVAITPGGWAEAGYLQSYRLVLQRRKGFVALAAQTGASLVPVLCLGEQDVVGPMELGYQVLKWVLPARPHPVQVVFGQALTPGQDESVAQLHARYVEALTALGKQHGVSLDIVE